MGAVAALYLPQTSNIQVQGCSVFDLTEEMEKFNWYEKAVKDEIGQNHLVGFLKAE